MIESYSYSSIWKNVMFRLWFYKLLQYFKYGISVGSENYLNFLYKLYV